VSLLEPGDGPSTAELLHSAIDTVRRAKAMPLSNNALVARSELLQVLEDALERLPEELRHARWMLRERDDFLSKTRREAEDILSASRAQAESLVQRSEIVRQAHHSAQRVVDRANDEARAMRRQAEEYCDRKLSLFEELLERTTKTVQSGRRKLQETPAVAVGDGLVSPGGGGGGAAQADEQTDASGLDTEDGGFFDQDRK
jgi:dsDNA-specific endonuclease/ATPase MutS2